MRDAIDMLALLNGGQPLDVVIGWRDGEPVRRAALFTRVRDWHTMLQDQPGRKFALHLGDTLEFASALLGAWQAGKTVYLPADTLPATCAALRHEVDGYLGEFAAEWSPMTASSTSSAPSDFHRLPNELIGVVVYTSGSSGMPQAIPKKLSQLAAEVATLESVFGAALRQADIVATVSHQHIYGLLFKLLWPLTAGRAIHARNFMFPEELTQPLTVRDCVLVSSPAHLKRLPDDPPWNAASLRVQAVFCSGGPLHGEDAQAAARVLTHTPIEVYGSSETGGIAWRQRKSLDDDGWTPLPGVAWRIDDDTGLLQVCSPHLPDSGWLQLADRATLAGNVRFLLQGRADRIVKIEEKRISLDTIERRLAASLLVAEARVVLTDGRRQRVAAFVVPSVAGRDVLTSLGKRELNLRLHEELSDAIEPVALPRIWRYLDALPMNAQGKTTQADLLALLDDIPVRPTLPRMRELERSEQRVVFELVAPSDLFYFDGHFPDTSILPGVVQVDWALAFGRNCFDLPPVFRGIHALKFQQVIRPNMPVMLELVHEPAKSSLSFRLSSSAGQHASGRLVFENSHV